VLNFLTTVGIITVIATGYSSQPWLIAATACVCLKAIVLVPFVTYEYYLLLFEHLFVDTSHYMGTQGGFFINNLKNSYLGSEKPQAANN